MEFRSASARDIAAIAALHADSWRRSYRGAYSDAYLDGDVVPDRLIVWSERLHRPSDNAYTIVAEDDGVIVGFTHVMFDEDPVWGALIDNLHVTYQRKRAGIGARLMSAGAAAVLARPHPTPLHLWVLEPNLAAQKFYAARGGELTGREDDESPTGDPLVALRYSWRHPADLLLDD